MYIYIIHIETLCNDYKLSLHTNLLKVILRFIMTFSRDILTAS